MADQQQPTDIDQFKCYIDEKFDSLAVKVNEMRGIEPVSLKKKGNQIQFEHASEILDFVTAAEGSLREEKKDAAVNKLKAAKKALHKRMKLICLADKSEGGWDTVNEYLSDELASDSDY